MKLACHPFGALLWYTDKGKLNQYCGNFIFLLIEFIFLELSCIRTIFFNIRETDDEKGFSYQFNNLR